jgi:hypothetical protein
MRRFCGTVLEASTHREPGRHQRKGSKSTDLVQTLVVRTNAALSTDAGQRSTLMSELSARAAAMVPFRDQVTVRSLVEMAVTSICSDPIRAV